MAADPAQHHLEAHRRRHVVGRHAADGARRGVHRGVLPGRGGGLQFHLLLLGRDEDRGARRSHREGPFRASRSRSPTDHSSARRLRSSRRPSSGTAWALRAQECTEQNFGPIGTGPFKVDEFRANDVITFSANENFRDPDKPAFATATFKGGGDAASARARGARDRRVRLRLEPAGGARGAHADGRRRQGYRRDLVRQTLESSA